MGALLFIYLFILFGGGGDFLGGHFGGGGPFGVRPLVTINRHLR